MGFFLAGAGGSVKYLFTGLTLEVLGVLTVVVGVVDGIGVHTVVVGVAEFIADAVTVVEDRGVLGTELDELKDCETST